MLGRPKPRSRSGTPGLAAAQIGPSVQSGISDFARRTIPSCVRKNCAREVRSPGLVAAQIGPRALSANSVCCIRCPLWEIEIDLVSLHLPPRLGETALAKWDLLALRLRSLGCLPSLRIRFCVLVPPRFPPLPIIVNQARINFPLFLGSLL